MGRSLGLSLPNRGVLFGATTVGDLYALAEEADGSGYFDSVWVGDGLIAKPRLEAIATLSALAARTERVRLGVCCMATFPLRQPVLFACQWASLDVLSGGRSLLAVCLGAPAGRGGGDFAAELRAMGASGGAERVGRMEEGIDVLRRLWSGPTAHDGTYWQFPEIDLEPKPLREDCPIWIASNPNPTKLRPDRYRLAIQRVGRLADGWLTTVTSPQEFGERWRDIQDAAKDAGRDPETLSSAIHLMVNIQDDEQSARREAKRFLDQYYATDVQAQTMDVWGAYGTAEQVRARIEEYYQAGVEEPILRFASFDQAGQMRRARAELLPGLVPR